MEHGPRRLKLALENLRLALEETETALLELEGTPLVEHQHHQQHRQQQGRPGRGRGRDLLSVGEVCQELGMGKSWVHQRIRSGLIPSIRLGHNIKVRREDLEGFLESNRYSPPEDEAAGGGEGSAG